MRPARIFGVGVGALIAAALVAAAPAPSCAQGGSSSDRARETALHVLEALGGAERFAALRGLRWDFGTSVNDTVRSTRHHAWDKATGWHRASGVRRDGVAFAVAHMVGDSTRGWATLGERSLSGDSLKRAIRRGEALWTNDTYWFLMPYKLLDPGVTLTDLGDTTLAGRPHRRLGLSFGEVGLTPGDRYTVFVDSGTWRVTRWAYVLEGQSTPPVEWIWDGWEQHEGLWFSTVRRAPEGSARAGTVIFTNALEAVREFPPGEFDAP